MHYPSHLRYCIAFIPFWLSLSAGAQNEEGTAGPEVQTESGTASAFRQQGVGSWYGKRFHGRKTASGERFDMHKMTAAHRTLPFGTWLRIKNLANGRQVLVRVNDRGPHIKGRIIDLSWAAARMLGFVKQGHALLEIVKVPPHEVAQMEPR